MIRVVLVDQYVIFRAGLKLLLETDGDISVVADGGSLEESLEMISGESPDLILMELCSDSRSVIELMDDIAAASPESRILLLANDQNGDAHGEAILAGAHGVISKDQSAEILRMAVKKVCEGEAWIDRTLTSKLLSGIRKHEIDAIDEQKKIDRLTPKELEITKLIAIGLVNKEVGNRLDISEKTVRNHLTVIYSKLHVVSRLELAIYATHNGIT